MVIPGAQPPRIPPLIKGAFLPSSYVLRSHFVPVYPYMYPNMTCIRPFWCQLWSDFSGGSPQAPYVLKPTSYGLIYLLIESLGAKFSPWQLIWTTLTIYDDVWGEESSGDLQYWWRLQQRVSNSQSNPYTKRHARNSVCQGGITSESCTIIESFFVVFEEMMQVIRKHCGYKIITKRKARNVLTIVLRGCRYGMVGIFCW